MKRLLRINAQPVTQNLKDAFRQVILEVKIALAHRKGLKAAVKLEGRDDIRLNLGCGHKFKAGWVNADLRRDADIILDLRKPFPFRDNCCEIAYSEHFLEHLDYPEPATRFVAECFRVLKPGGMLSLAVPDTELVVRSYVLGGSDEYYAAQRYWNPKWCETQMEHVNHTFRQHTQHRFCYDLETMERMLAEVGFHDIRRRDFDPTLDSREREYGSMYIEALKPVGKPAVPERELVAVEKVETSTTP